MKLYAQHGFGKSDKIDRGFEDGLLDGVIIGPNNERPDSLFACVQRYSELDSNPDIMIDPQLYVSLLSNAKEGNLPLYEDYYVSDLSLRDFTARRIAELVRNTLEFQLRLPITHLLSPTILLESFTNRSTQIAHFLAQESIEYHNSLDNPPPLLLSYVFHEPALSSHDQVREFLDTVSLYTASGFYFVVVRPTGSQYQQSFSPERMAEWLLMIYSLGVRSRFQVVCGYTDFLAYPAAAAGATASATGWFNTLRQFDVKRFQPSTGGARPKERYSSGPLLNSIFFQELVNAYDAEVADRVFTRTRYDRILRQGQPDPSNWPADLSTLHHWATLAKLFETLDDKNTRERLITIESAIASASDTYRSLLRRDVQFDPITGPAHLAEWMQAIAMLRSFARL
jgi:hypothetical protein